MKDGLLGRLLRVLSDLFRRPVKKFRGTGLAAPKISQAKSLDIWC